MLYNADNFQALQLCSSVLLIVLYNMPHIPVFVQVEVE
jgi:hypothetical protein